MKTLVHVIQKSGNVNAADHSLKAAQVGTAGLEHPTCPAEIAFFKMEESDSRLDQALKHRLFGAGQFAPEVFPDIVTGEELPLIEEPNAFIDARI